jgi:hypothetical protein
LPEIRDRSDAVLPLEEGARAALGGKSAAAAEIEKDRRIRQLERTLGRKSPEIEIPRNVVGE